MTKSVRVFAAPLELAESIFGIQSARPAAQIIDEPVHIRPNVGMHINRPAGIVNAPVAGRASARKSLAVRPPRRRAHAALSEISHLARSDASIPATDPLGDQADVLLGRLLRREMTGVERMNLVVRKDLVEVLVVRPRNEVITASGDRIWVGGAIDGRRSRNTGFCCG